jgi:hypothetical protein
MVFGRWRVHFFIQWSRVEIQKYVTDRMQVDKPSWR